MKKSLELRQKLGKTLDEWKAAMEARDAETNPDERAKKETEVQRLKALHARQKSEVATQEAFEAEEKEAAGDNLRDQDRRGGASGQQTPEEKARKEFRLLRALKTIADKRSLDGIELEMYQEANREARESGVALSGDIRIPSFIMTTEKRDMVAGTAGQGGYTIETNLGSLIEFLMPRLVIEQLGARKLTGLTGTLDLPRQITMTAGVWEGENTSADETNITFDKLTLSPKRLAAFVDVSKQWMIQSSVPAENFVRNDLNNAVRIALDTAFINGATGGNNPVGILNTTGIGSVAIGTNGGAPTWAHIVDLWSEIASDNADVNTLNYLTTPGIAAKLMQTEKASSTGQFIWNSNNREGNVNGYGAVTSTLVPSTLTKGSSTDCHAIIFGDFSSMIIGQWAGVDITVDPYTRAKEAIVVLTVNSWWDAVIRHAESFAAIKDARIV